MLNSANELNIFSPSSKVFPRIIFVLFVSLSEFLLKSFDSLFNYSYTSEMEKNLDLVSQGEMDYKKICKFE